SPDTTKARNANVRIKNEFRRRSSQGNDDFGTNDANLLHEKGRTAFDFIRLRRAIVGWTALQDVGDVNLVAGQSHCMDDVGEFLPGPAHKRTTGLILFLARGFS